MTVPTIPELLLLGKPLVRGPIFQPVVAPRGYLVAAKLFAAVDLSQSELPMKSGILVVSPLHLELERFQQLLPHT